MPSDSAGPSRCPWCCGGFKNRGWGVSAARRHRPGNRAALVPSCLRTVGRRWQAEEVTAGVALLGGPAQRRRSLTFGGVVAWRARVHGETRKEIQAPPQATEGAVVRQQEALQGDQIRGAGYRATEVFKSCFQILLGSLLAMKTSGIMGGLATACELADGDKGAFRFSHPRARAFFHTGSCPWSPARCGRIRLPPAAIGGCAVCGR